MRIAKGAKVEKVASKDRSRPVLAHLFVREGDEPGSGTLEATDSYALVRVPVELDEGDTAGFVTSATLTEARKGAVGGEVELTVNGSVSYRTKEGGEVSATRPEPGKFPDTAQLFPSELSTFEVGLNPKLLLGLAEAMGSADRVKLTFARKSGSSVACDSDPLRPILVEPLTGGVDGANGILMPVRVG